MNTLNPPGWVSKTNNNTDMIRYAAQHNSLTKKSSLKRSFTISYDINATNEFLDMSSTTKKTHERTWDAMEIVTDTPTTGTIPNEDDISTLLDENNKIDQATVTKIISENNATNKLIFLQILEDNNKRIKLDIMETLKTTMEGNNK